jgi:hypothetical protein
MPNLTFKELAQRSISKGICECSDFLNQPHQEHLAMESMKKILKCLANAGNAISGIMEDPNEIADTLEKLCKLSDYEELNIENTLLSLQDFDLMRIYIAANLISWANKMQEIITREVFYKEEVEAEDVKMAIGKILRGCSALANQYDLKISDCVISILQTIERADD